MKKFLAIIFILSFCLVGCSNENNNSQNVPEENTSYNYTASRTTTFDENNLENNVKTTEPEIAKEPEPKPETPTEGYLVKVKADVLNIRKGPGTNYGTNGSIKDRGVYTIVAEADGQGASKWGKLKSGAGWIALDYTEKQTSATPSVPATPAIIKGCKVKFTGTKSYSGITLASWTKNSIFDVIEVSGDRVVIGKGTAVTAAVNMKDCIRV